MTIYAGCPQTPVTSWVNQPIGEGDRHVYPLYDDRPHILVGRLCSCRPDVEHFPVGDLVIHHAWDGREHFELGGPYRPVRVDG